MSSATDRVTDWLESGVADISGFIPPGRAASEARNWAAELQCRTGVQVDGAQLLGERAAFTGQTPGGPTSAGGACRMLPCSDGWVAVSLPRPSDLELVAALVESDVEDPWADVARWAAEHPGSVVVDRARLLGLAVSQVGGEASLPLDLPADVAPAPLDAPVVVDFSALWAGPLCASLLGLAGARVIKVESPGRPDGARFGNRQFYELLHSGHESVTLDPRRDRARLSALVDEADVVIEASRPRALAGWGVSAQEAVAAGTIWVSITAYGRDPGDRIGFGDDVAAGVGLVGWIGGRPSFAGDAIADPLTGLAAAVAALRALAARSHDGRGRLLDIAMASVVAATLDGAPMLPRPIDRLAAPPVGRSIAG
jgi:crotonobetainyl-CoA:carnitine CoA-transferase CaiB-like acyl-CoA transferase